MSQQYNKVIKRQRRAAYLKRRKHHAKQGKAPAKAAAKAPEPAAEKA